MNEGTQDAGRRTQDGVKTPFGLGDIQDCSVKTASIATDFGLLFRVFGGRGFSSRFLLSIGPGHSGI